MSTRYEIDPYNRLVLNGSGQKNGLKKFRQVIEGRFRTDENNNLYYQVKAPLSETENIPNQLRLKGEWSLTDNHDMRLTLDRQSRETFGDQITLQGEVLDVNESSLLFAVTARTGSGRSTYILDLSGSWKADEHNRLSFHVKKESGKYDILTFNGTWKIDENNQIIYEYNKASLTKKRRCVHALTFKGFWDIRDKFRISYILYGNSDSVFDFQARSGVFKEDYIKYEIGIGLAGRIKPIKRIIALSGRWMVKKDAGLIFEITYGDGKINTMKFGAQARLTDKDLVSFNLKNDMENRELGIELELSRKILKGDGEAFLRLLKSNEESAVYIGSAFRW